MADALEHLKAVHSGEHQVEEDRVPLAFPDLGESFGAGVRGHHLVAHRIQIASDQTAQFAVIVDEQNGMAVWICGGAGLHEKEN